MALLLVVLVASIGWLWMTLSVLREFNPNLPHLLSHNRNQPQLGYISYFVHNITRLAKW